MKTKTIVYVCGVLILIGLLGLIILGQTKLYNETPKGTIEPTTQTTMATVEPPVSTPKASPSSIVEPTTEPEVPEVKVNTSETTTPVETPNTGVTKVYYDCPFDTKLQDLIYANLDTFSIDLNLSDILALVFKESGFKQVVESGAGAKGYMQLMDNTFTFAYDACIQEFPELDGMTYDVFDEETNITLGMWYLHHIASELGYESVNSENFDRVLCSYNRGMTGARNYYNSYGTYVTSYSTKIAEVAAQIETDGGITVYH